MDFGFPWNLDFEYTTTKLLLIAKSTQTKKFN